MSFNITPLPFDSGSSSSSFPIISTQSLIDTHTNPFASNFAPSTYSAPSSSSSSQLTSDSSIKTFSNMEFLKSCEAMLPPHTNLTKPAQIMESWTKEKCETGCNLQFRDLLLAHPECSSALMVLATESDATPCFHGYAKRNQCIHGCRTLP